MKLPAMIHVDLDSLRTIAEFFGARADDGARLIHTVAVPRFLKLFRAQEIKATFFVVGRDLSDETTVATLRQVLAEGHEVANHTMNHPFRMRGLPREQKAREIRDGHNVLLDRLGVEAVGFRAPGYDVDEEMLEILHERGYLYDSSLFPSFLVPVIKAYTIMIQRSRLGHALDGYGKFIYGFGPIAPYRPRSGALEARGEMFLVEIPVSMMPFLRVPLHSTTLFATSPGLVRLGNWLLSLGGIPYTFLLHGVDLLDFEDDRVPDGLRVCPTFRKRLREKLELLEGLLRELTATRAVILSADYARLYLQGAYSKEAVQ